MCSTCTEDLEALADWLLERGITTAAMESTAVCWIPLYQILEDRGIQVCLTSARQMRNVPRRRTDWQECQWLQYLHAVGLPRAAFRPEQQVCAARSLLRHRRRLVSATPLGQFFRRMKARLGAPGGITATAYKIARISCAIVSRQVEYDKTIWRQQDAQRERREQNKLKRRARKLGFQLVPIQAG